MFACRLEGENLSAAHGGPGMHARLTYDSTDPNRMLSKMEMSPDGANWMTLFDGSYRCT